MTKLLYFDWSQGEHQTRARQPHHGLAYGRRRARGLAAGSAGCPHAWPLPQEDAEGLVSVRPKGPSQPAHSALEAPPQPAASSTCRAGTTSATHAWLRRCAAVFHPALFGGRRALSPGFGWSGKLWACAVTSGGQSSTRQWLVDNNGDAIPGGILSEIIEVGRPPLGIHDGVKARRLRGWSVRSPPGRRVAGAVGRRPPARRLAARRGSRR